MSRLGERVAVVTGGATGIGRACAERLAAEGARVVIADIAVDAGQRTAGDIAKLTECVFLRTDISDAESGAACIRETVHRFGRLDILVNCAALLASRLPMDAAPMERVRRLFEVNAFGTCGMIELAAPEMARNRWGRIVNVASEAAYLLSGVGPATRPPTPEQRPPSVFGEGFAWNIGAYGWSKHALIQLTKTAAVQLGPWGINVNCICPGPTATDAYIEALGEAHAQQAALSAPVKQVGRPTDQAAAVAFLASDDCAMVTGQVIMVDGGRKLPA